MTAIKGKITKENNEQSGDSRQRHLLIVDDDDICREIMVGYLRKEGYFIKQVADGNSAIRECKQFTYDLAILDIQMPDMDGIEVARRIDPIPVIFISQVDNPTVINRALEERALGAAPIAYMEKPAKDHLLRRTVKIALNICDALSEKSRLIESLTLTYEQERKELAQEMHDHLGQVLLAVQLDLSLIAKTTQETTTKERIEQMLTQLRQINKDVKNVVLGLYPEELDLLGLAKSIELMAKQLAYRLKIDVDLRVSENINDMTSSESVSIYRIVQEALTNIGKHAQATSFSVEIVRRSKKESEEIQFSTNDVLVVRIADNGAGMEGRTKDPNSMGVKGMRERVRVLGGSFKMESSKNEGTRIDILIPLKQKELQ